MLTGLAIAFAHSFICKGTKVAVYLSEIILSIKSVPNLHSQFPDKFSKDILKRATFQGYFILWFMKCIYAIVQIAQGLDTDMNFNPRVFVSNYISLVPYLLFLFCFVLEVGVMWLS